MRVLGHHLFYCYLYNSDACLHVVIRAAQDERHCNQIHRSSTDGTYDEMFLLVPSESIKTYCQLMLAALNIAAPVGF